MDNEGEAQVFDLGSLYTYESKSTQHDDDEVPVCILPPRPRTAPTKNFQELNIPRRQLSNISYPIQEAQRWLTLIGKDNKVHRYPLPTILPKVVQTRFVPPKQLPKDVEVDRRRRQYARINLLEELCKVGITDDELQPTEEQYHLLSDFAFKHKFPLSFFDNSDFCIYTPEAWFALGIVDNTRYPIPARAYLPCNRSLMRYKWVSAEVISYCEETRLWTVNSLVDDITYQVPNIQFMFLAENPHAYIKRLQYAIAERHNGEMLMQMELIVDCVLLDDIETIEFYTFKPIETMLQTAKTSTTFKHLLSIEVNLVFERLMALYELEKFIHLMPKEFPQFRNIQLAEFLPHDFVLPLEEEVKRYAKNYVLVMKTKCYDLRKATLFYCGGAIEAMEAVAVECRYIEKLSMFVVSFAKPLPLSDFLQVQEQHSDKKATYLKINWPQQITTVVCLVLRPLGKGWLDISLDNWTVYMMCKISRFIFQTKLRMQESMQILLENSLDSFMHFVCDPCMQFLDLKSDYRWRSNYIETEFPYSKPVFSLVISINEDAKVFYSTTPEDFKPGLMDVFKRALEKSSGVCCVDAKIMTNLRFAPNLFILTVELIEDHYVRNADLIERCYTAAVFPLHAYAKLFERWAAFYLLNVNKYMQEYAQARKPSSQVKADILEHKRLKEELREILPASITIGPFLVNVDPLKQYLIKKHIDIVRRIFEYYVDRMYETNDNLLERCMDIYNRIHERPISIEHLFEIRDFALTVPDIIESLKGDIQIMWLEYDLLDNFFYNLSDHQFAMKWNVYAWPHNIMMRLSTLKEEQKNDIEDFMRQHSVECMAFEERLENLNDEVQAFSLIFNANKAAETAVDVKKTWTLIGELEKLGKTLQYRQILFEMEPLSLEFLESIIAGFMPYKQLWYSCSSFLKLEEATLGNPLLQIELEEVWNNLMDIRNDLVQCLDLFSEKPEIMDVANVFIGKIDDFVPVYNSITHLRNENWMFMHWQELAARTGAEIKYTVAMNYQYLARKGILDYLDIIEEISTRANNEAEEMRRVLEEEARRKLEEEEASILRKQMRKCRRDIL